MRVGRRILPITSLTKIGCGWYLGSLSPAAFTAFTLTRILEPVGSPVIVNFVLSVSSGLATIHSSASLGKRVVEDESKEQEIRNTSTAWMRKIAEQ